MVQRRYTSLMQPYYKEFAQYVLKDLTHQQLKMHIANSITEPWIDFCFCKMQ